MISNPRPCVTSGAYYARHKSTSTFHDYYFNNKVQSPAGLKAPYNQVPPGGLDSIRLRRKKKHAHLRSSLFRIVGGTQTSIWKKKFNYKKKKFNFRENGRPQSAGASLPVRKKKTRLDRAKKVTLCHQFIVQWRVKWKPTSCAAAGQTTKIESRATRSRHQSLHPSENDVALFTNWDRWAHSSPPPKKKKNSLNFKKIKNKNGHVGSHGNGH